MVRTLRFLPSLEVTRWVSPLRARFPGQNGAWLCRSSLQGSTLRRRRFAPATVLARPSGAFNCGF